MKNILVSFTGYKLNKNKPEVIYLLFFLPLKPFWSDTKLHKEQNSLKFMCVFKP